MKKKIIISIIALVLLLSALIWYIIPFSYSVDSDVEFNISVDDKLIMIYDEGQKDTLIKLVEGLRLQRGISGSGNYQTKDYIFLRANWAAQPYLGFHLSRQDLNSNTGERPASADTQGNQITNPQELILYLERLIRETE